MGRFRGRDSVKGENIQFVQYSPSMESPHKYVCVCVCVCVFLVNPVYSW